MKKSIIILAVIAIVGLIVTGAYAGTASPSVSVSGTVNTMCVVGGTGTLAFGTLDADTNSSGATATFAGMTLWCTRNDSVAFSVSNGNNYSGGTRNLKDSGTNLIPYTVSFTTPVAGQGRNDTTTMITNLALTATIAAGALNQVPAGSYSDTVVLTITY